MWIRRFCFKMACNLNVCIANNSNMSKPYILVFYSSIKYNYRLSIHMDGGHMYMFYCNCDWTNNNNKYIRSRRVCMLYYDVGLTNSIDVIQKMFLKHEGFRKSRSLISTKTIPVFNDHRRFSEFSHGGRHRFLVPGKRIHFVPSTLARVPTLLILRRVLFFFLSFFIFFFSVLYILSTKLNPLTYFVPPSSDIIMSNNLSAICSRTSLYRVSSAGLRFVR